MNAAEKLIRLTPLPGGIHPPENKQQSLNLPIQQAPAVSSVSIVVTQPRHEQPELLVSVGDRVLLGQQIARGKHNFGQVCHATISGEVVSIDERPVANVSGLEELCVTIKNDGKNEWIPHEGQADYMTLDRKKIINLIAEAGIIGLGGAGFPSHIKLGGQSSINTLIINAVECEPYITADDALMREQAEDIITGIQILMHLLKPTNCLIGIEDNKPEAQAALSRANNDARIQIVEIPTRYPSGAEKQLIQILTGKEIPSGTLAIQQGILCHNIGTCYAIARAICHGEPLVSRITTFTGQALERPCNMEVPLGASVLELLEACGLDHRKISSLIMGGPMMGIQLPALDLPLVKISNCFIAPTAEEIPPPKPAQPCIRCGMCAEACPVSLLPQQLYWFARGKEHEKAEQHNLMDCIECGACAYVCPSNIPLVQYYRASKASIREEKDKHRRAEHSQKRFELHQERMEKEKAEAEKRRQERAELARKKMAAKKDNEGEDPIQAALARVKAKQAKAADEDK